MTEQTRRSQLYEFYWDLYWPQSFTHSGAQHVLHTKVLQALRQWRATLLSIRQGLDLTLGKQPILRLGEMLKANLQRRFGQT